jgi:hypothetical protein
MLDQIKVVDHMRLPPEGTGTVRALSRIGYDLPAALADLIDNSIDAHASRVDITFFRNDREITAVTISDDGQGMNSSEMRLGMQFAGRTKHDPTDLGTYGLGLKSASFSQCKTMSVVSRQGGETVGSRWSAESIDNDWQCDVLDADGARAAFDRLCMPGKSPATGTVVIWERLTRLTVGSGDDDLDTFLNAALAGLSRHLGLTFHRFLDHEALTITLTVRHERRSLALPRNVRPLDPCGYSSSGLDGYPKTFRTNMPGMGEIELLAHVWPYGSMADNFLLGSRNGAPFQGFYFYRNNRLIQAGGWNGVVKNDQDPDLICARVTVELPTGGLDVNVQKSALQVTAAQSQALSNASAEGETLENYLAAARGALAAAKRRDEEAEPPPLVPGSGVPSTVRRLARKKIAKDGDAQEIDFVWEDLPDDKIFDLDLLDTRILLNKNHRHAILAGATASAADAPFVKTLMFLLFAKDFERQRFSNQRREQIAIQNLLLLEALKK